jgi:glycosyltransferase involved in cell wall biosynthesis
LGYHKRLLEARTVKIHALCLVKNEDDIIEQTLRAALRWCDWIYVLDNGSADGTWETVRTLARQMPGIVPYKQAHEPFTDSLRARIYSRFRSRAVDGDWWCILDADEFYIDDSREFLEAVPKRFSSVWMQRYTYLFTDKDLAAYRRDPRLFEDSVPIDSKLRHYVVGEYSEKRFFRHQPHIAELDGYDFHPIYPKRIRLKHFAYRSPDQIRTRLETRREAMLRGEFLHEKRANWEQDGRIVPGPAQPSDLPRSWEERVVSSASCHFDAGDGTYAEPMPWVPPRGRAWAFRMRRSAFAVLRRAFHALMAR